MSARSGDLSAPGLAEVDVIDRRETAEELARRSVERARRDPVAYEVRPGLETGDYLVTRTGPFAAHFGASTGVGSVEVENHLVLGDGREVPDLWN